MSAMKDMNVSSYEMARRQDPKQKYWHPARRAKLVKQNERLLKDLLLITSGALFILILDVAWELSK